MPVLPPARVFLPVKPACAKPQSLYELGSCATAAPSKGRIMSIRNVMATVDVASRRRAGVTAALVVLVVLLLLASLGIGPVKLSPLTVLDALFGGGTDVQQVIVREIRLPRALLGFAIGAILGLSGAALQGLLRNPLAAPSLFGAPQSAAFGAVSIIALGLADVRSYALPTAAVAMAFASVFVLLAIAGR